MTLMFHQFQTKDQFTFNKVPGIDQVWMIQPGWNDPQRRPVGVGVDAPPRPPSKIGAQGSFET